MSDGIPAGLAPPVKLNQRRSLAHCGGLSISLLVLLAKHQQPPGSAPQVRAHVTSFSRNVLSTFKNKYLPQKVVLSVRASLIKLKKSQLVASDLRRFLYSYSAKKVQFLQIFISYIFLFKSADVTLEAHTM